MAEVARPRRLSDYEYVAFTNEIDLVQLNFPPWGGVVQWNGMEVLVYEAPGGLFLTDITPIRSQIEIAPPWEYNELAQYWVWHLPAETFGRIVEVVNSTITIGGWVWDYKSLIFAAVGGVLLYKVLK